MHGPGARAAGFLDRGTGVRPARARSPGSGSGRSLGLGLALSKGFVEAMGGTLSLDDTPGGGLTMVVSLPEAPAAALLVQEPAS